VARGERAEGAEEVGDGAAAGGEQRRGQQVGEAPEGRGVERGGEGQQERAGFGR
jgi:hypothetical protein